MIVHSNLSRLMLSLAMFTFCSGCGGSSSSVDLASISGKVSFKGQPVPYGLIYFEPDITRGNHGPQGFAEIIDGKYHTDNDGMGVVTGPLLVRISGFAKGATSAGTLPSNPLFSQYQTQVELLEETKTLDFDVPGLH